MRLKSSIDSVNTFYFSIFFFMITEKQSVKKVLTASNSDLELSALSLISVSDEVFPCVFTCSVPDIYLAFNSAY